MNTHRIRELRRQRNLTQEDLAKTIGRSKSVISRIESGETTLDIGVARQIAQALNASLAEVLDIQTAPQLPGDGFAEEEIVDYVPSGPSDPYALLAGENCYLVEVRTDALDRVGIRRGDVVEIDASAAAVAGMAPLDVVRVQYHPDPDNPSFAVPLLRQYVPPSLLIVNSSTVDVAAIDTQKEDAIILGVVRSTHRRYR